MIGGIGITQGMLDFCAERGIASESSSSRLFVMLCESTSVDRTRILTSVMRGS
jgi:hypothetical protein